eukprot:5731651-Prymnesium_polylepis.1
MSFVIHARGSDTSHTPTARWWPRSVRGDAQSRCTAGPRPACRPQRRPVRPYRGGPEVLRGLKQNHSQFGAGLLVCAP